MSADIIVNYHCEAKFPKFCASILKKILTLNCLVSVVKIKNDRRRHE